MFKREIKLSGYREQVLHGIRGLHPCIGGANAHEHLVGLVALVVDIVWSCVPSRM